ncbi:MAG: hypothetical protein AABX04_01125 [Nanoarchaeota archaeon]
MLEEKLNFLGKIRTSIQKNIGIYSVIAGLSLGALGCGPEEVSCRKPTNENYSGTNRCAGSVYGTPYSIDTCSLLDKFCVCKKPEGAPDSECECNCVSIHEPHEKGW